jgi:hypothetical protein
LINKKFSINGKVERQILVLLTFVNNKTLNSMKKLLVPTSFILLAIGCSQKNTPSKSLPSSNNSAPVIVDKPVVTTTPAANTTATSTNATNSNGTNGSKTATPREGAGNSQDAIDGMAIYNQKCNKCHGYKITTDYTWERWASIMQVMAMKANLSETEKQKVLAYVHANAKPS